MDAIDPAAIPFNAAGSDEEVPKRLDSLGTTTVKMIRAANAVVQEAVDPHDPPFAPRFARFFLLDLESHLNEFDRLFFCRAPDFTRAAVKLTKVPINRFGYWATSWHGLAKQIAQEVLDAGHALLNQLAPNEFEREWERVQARLKPMATFDAEELTAGVIAEQDFCRDVSDPPAKQSNDGAAVSTPPKRPSRAEYNVRAREYLKEHPYAGPRELRRHLGCGMGTVYKLPAFIAVRGEHKKGRKPKAVSLTKGMESAARKDDGELARLTAEQRKAQRSDTVGTRERL